MIVHKCLLLILIKRWISICANVTDSREHHALRTSQSKQKDFTFTVGKFKQV